MKLEPAVTRRLAHYAASSPRILEYGCGESTRTFAASPAQHIHSVESDAKWIERLSHDESINAAIAQRRLSMRHAFIGPVKEWGYPADETNRALWPHYASAAWSEGGAFDFIFVDGRFRVACILQAVLHAQDDSLIAVHDFWNRPPYHVVLPFLEWKESCETLGVFTRRSGNADLVSALLAKYRFIPG